MGPIQRYLGPDVPTEELIWQDRIPALDHVLVDEADLAGLKAQILESGLTVAQLVSAAWASASTFRISDKRGGANGARIALAPQKDWEANNPADLAQVLDKLSAIRTAFNASAGGGKQVSLADLIVLGGGAAIEKAAKDAGSDLAVPFTPGRMDASQAQTDVHSFAALEPRSDGFRNFRRGVTHFLARGSAGRQGAVAGAERAGDDGAGGRSARAGRQYGGRWKACSPTVRELTHDFFVNLLDMDTQWSPLEGGSGFLGLDRKTRAPKWSATRVISCSDRMPNCAPLQRSMPPAMPGALCSDFAAAWAKVMNADRYDLTA
jgi:catalase-peroxidase